MSSSPSIAIVGAGPGGLATAVLLEKHSIPYTVFELRQRPTDEELAQPSGSLDLHEESGIAAVKACGLYDTFVTLTGECSEDQRIADKTGKVIYSDQGGPEGRPEISRHSLTKMLLDNVPAERIRWGQKLESVQTTAQGQTELHFADSSAQPEAFDLVIGADGAWSKVRANLTTTKPIYDNMQYLVATIRNATANFPHLADLVGKGSFSCLGDHHGIMTQRGAQDSIRVMVAIQSEDEHYAATKGFADKDATAAGNMLLGDDSLLGLWGDNIKDLVRTACAEEASDHPGEATFARPLYRLPTDLTWQTKASCTVIGDAAHVMGPWAGEGVNLALRDSMLLVEGIARIYKNGPDAFQKEKLAMLQEVETSMMENWRPFAKETIGNKGMLFGSANGAQSFVEFFKQFMPPETFTAPGDADA